MIDDSSSKINYPADLEPYKSNVLLPYVRLYNMLNKHIEFYYAYTSYMKKIIDDYTAKSLS
jgi:hypothetical protein